MMNSKGQADVVFELLIAVILLSFVFLVGSYSMDALAKTKCSREIDASLSSFSRNIANVLTQPLGSSYVYFSIPNCFGPNYSVKIIKKEDSDMCSVYCKGALRSCYLLEYKNLKDKVMPYRYKCVDIPSITLININDCSNDIDNYELLNNEANLKAGKYLIVSKSVVNPVLCLYKQKRD